MCVRVCGILHRRINYSICRVKIYIKAEFTYKYVQLQTDRRKQTNVLKVCSNNKIPLLDRPFQHLLTIKLIEIKRFATVFHKFYVANCYSKIVYSWLNYSPIIILYGKSMKWYRKSQLFKKFLSDWCYYWIVKNPL